ncbi:MAG: response regulator [Deltaproteobacteria bacterium]|nr:response regulator [Deltaproteobacteria bacterium]MBW2662642.1 response regulator [Deltaproteobacteria bacterium]
MKVLLVDDEEELISAMAERLSLRGIAASCAVTYIDALDQAKIRAFDVAVLDVKMPTMSGFELKSKLQEIRPDMKFIFLTGHGSDADFESAAQDIGKEYYLMKPLDINVLVQKLREVIIK